MGQSETAGAQADLFDRFLAGDVEHAVTGMGEAGGGLQQQGGFADAGVAGEQHGGGRHQAAAEDAVEFGDADGGARRRRGGAGEVDEGKLVGGRLGFLQAGTRRGGRFLGDGVPLAAGLAVAGPFRGDGAAGGADEAGGGFGHAL